MLENRKKNLKKVDSKEAQSPPASDVTDSTKTNQSSEANSVQDRILKFKEAEKGIIRELNHYFNSYILYLPICIVLKCLYYF